MLDGSAAFVPISEKELQERMALEGLDGPVGSLRDDMNAAKIVQAVQIGQLKPEAVQDLDEAAVQWNQRESDDRKRRKLWRRFHGKRE